MLFHGTILYDFNLKEIENFLKHPPKEPGYRKSRTHLDFVRNIPIKKDELIVFLKINLI